jgi:hypothetical protein
LENDPEEKQVLSAQLKTLGLNIKEDYFKITNLAAGKSW